MTEEKREEYAVILNFETAKVECLSLENRPTGMDTEEYIEEVLEYRLSNCEWMGVTEKPEIEPLNY
jgi:hypothetical protein